MDFSEFGGRFVHAFDRPNHLEIYMILGGGLITWECRVKNSGLNVVV